MDHRSGCSQAAAETAKELLALAAEEEKGFRPGLVAVVQTFEDRANFHPHAKEVVYTRKGGHAAREPAEDELAYAWRRRDRDRGARVLFLLLFSAASPFTYAWIRGSLIEAPDRVRYSITATPPVFLLGIVLVATGLEWVAGFTQRRAAVTGSPPRSPAYCP